MRSPHKQRSDLTLQLAADDRGSERPTWRCRDRLSLSFAWLAPLNRGSLNSAHIHGTHVPVEEPSTASQPDINPSCYSIASSARASSDGGTINPSAFAVLRLIASWYFVGACTGRLAGFSPLEMRST